VSTSSFLLFFSFSFSYFPFSPLAGDLIGASLAPDEALKQGLAKPWLGEVGLADGLRCSNEIISSTIGQRGKKRRIKRAKYNKLFKN